MQAERVEPHAAMVEKCKRGAERGRRAGEMLEGEKREKRAEAGH